MANEVNVVAQRFGALLKGFDGWSPILAVVSDGNRRVHRIADWTGGTGTKPAVGLYIGASGFVVAIADAVDIRGPAGAGEGGLVTSVNGEAPDGSGNVTLTKEDIGLGNVDNTASIPLDQKGANNGVAPLDSTGRVPAGNLPSFVDDVLEFVNLAAFPGTGESGKIYIALNTNAQYRWSGSAYVQMVASPGSSDAVTEGVTNRYFTAARETATLATAAADATTKANAAAAASVPLAQKGANNGVAPLDGTGRVPAANLPSYVDDVLEFANLAAFPGTGETGKIYIALNTNAQYRWSGSAYVQMVASPGSSDAVTEGVINRYFTTARESATLAAAAAASAPRGLITAAGLSFSAAGRLLYAGAAGAPIEVDTSALFDVAGGRLLPKNLTTDHYNVVTQGSVQITTATNQASAIEAAHAAANGRILWLPAGDILCEDANLVLSASAQSLRIEGPGRLVYRNGHSCINVHGEWGAQTTVSTLVPSVLAADVSPEVSEVVIPSTTGWSRDDVFKVWCNVEYPNPDEFGDSTFIAETRQVLRVDAANNKLRFPTLDDGTLMAAASQIALRKMIPRTVDIAVRIAPLGNQYATDGVGRFYAVTLNGLLRPKYSIVLEGASGGGVNDRSCYESDGEVFLRNGWNGTETGVSPVVYGYGHNYDRGSTRCKIKIRATTCRHAQSTTFWDGTGAFNHADFLEYGELQDNVIEDSFISTATGTSYDCHWLCKRLVRRNCIGVGNFIINGASGEAIFSDRGRGTVNQNCIAIGGDKGFIDTSGRYPYRKKTVNRTENCLSIGAKTAGFFVDGAENNTNVDQHVEFINISSDNRYGDGLRGQAGMEIREQHRVVIRGFRACGFGFRPIRINPVNPWVGTLELDASGLDFDYSDVGTSARGIECTSTFLRLKARFGKIVIRGSTARPLTSFIEFPSLPVSVDIEFEEKPISRDRRLTLVSGSLPSGARVYCPNFGAGPTVPYGTIPSVGDASVSITPRTADTWQFNDPLTAARTATIVAGSDPDQWRKGDPLEIIRTEDATGAGTLTITGTAGLIGFTAFTLAPGESARFRYDGARMQRLKDPATSGGGSPAVVQISDFLAADFTTTSATPADTGLEFAIGAGESWVFDAALMGQVSTTAGMRIEIDGPSGATLRAHMQGNTSSASGYNVNSFYTAFNAPPTGTATFWTVAATEMSAYLRGTVTATTAGTVKIRARSVTAGDTTTLRAFSSLRATKAA